jgi:invasion protein IalB
MNRLVTIAAALAAFVCWSGLGHAQSPTPGQDFKDWRYDCVARKAAAGTTAAPGAPQQVCLIQHEVRNGSSLLLAARVRIIGPQKQAILLLFLPPSLPVDTPIGFAIDQGAMAATQVRQCNAQLCWAIVPLGDELLGSLKAGWQLTVVVKPGAAESRLVVSLNGFTGAFAALQSAVQ